MDQSKVIDAKYLGTKSGVWIILQEDHSDMKVIASLLIENFYWRKDFAIREQHWTLFYELERTQTVACQEIIVYN